MSSLAARQRKELAGKQVFARSLDRSGWSIEKIAVALGVSTSEVPALLAADMPQQTSRTQLGATATAQRTPLRLIQPRHERKLPNGYADKRAVAFAVIFGMRSTFRRAAAAAGVTEATVQTWIRDAGLNPPRSAFA